MVSLIISASSMAWIKMGVAASVVSVVFGLLLLPLFLKIVDLCLIEITIPTVYLIILLRVVRISRMKSFNFDSGRLLFDRRLRCWWWSRCCVHGLSLMLLVVGDFFLLTDFEFRK